MAIPEKQLDTWSHQGSITQSSTTYQSVKGILEASDTPYAKRSHTSFLQGSYGNDTNIWADSDVDIVMRINSVFYHDLSGLDDVGKAAFETTHSTAEYSYTDFKRDVIAVLKKAYGDAVSPGSKAIFVAGNGARRDVDVLVAAQFRRYFHFRSYSDQRYVEGICFWNANGNQIVNYPKQHSANCTTKHQGTNQWFKPTVRILKNMRNRMIDDGYLADGIAPSYYLEGMLYNVPAGCFGVSWEDTVVASINWLLKADRSKLLCANEQYYLLNPTSNVTWRADQFEAYLNAFVKYWKDW
ncbi:nucleotidyltransferase domain-containing protein [Blastomonas fulva]|uniref:nucleotidyltransferase domain-containing protein n=1 Tax=Blastomonas fulva TaxID=1550728 RepID=UPI003F6EEE31